jgi:hypothetical protein
MAVSSATGGIDINALVNKKLAEQQGGTTTVSTGVDDAVYGDFANLKNNYSEKGGPKVVDGGTIEYDGGGGDDIPPVDWKAIGECFKDLCEGVGEILKAIDGLGGKVKNEAHLKNNYSTTAGQTALGNVNGAIKNWGDSTNRDFNIDSRLADRAGWENLGTTGDAAGKAAETLSGNIKASMSEIKQTTGMVDSDLQTLLEGKSAVETADNQAGTEAANTEKSANDKTSEAETNLNTQVNAKDTAEASNASTEAKMDDKVSNAAEANEAAQTSADNANKTADAAAKGTEAAHNQTAAAQEGVSNASEGVANAKKSLEEARADKTTASTVLSQLANAVKEAEANEKAALSQLGKAKEAEKTAETKEKTAKDAVKETETAKTNAAKAEKAAIEARDNFIEKSNEHIENLEHNIADASDNLAEVKEASAEAVKYAKDVKSNLDANLKAVNENAKAALDAKEGLKAEAEAMNEKNKQAGELVNQLRTRGQRALELKDVYKASDFEVPKDPATKGEDKVNGLGGGGNGDGGGKAGKTGSKGGKGSGALIDVGSYQRDVVKKNDYKTDDVLTQQKQILSNAENILKYAKNGTSFDKQFAEDTLRYLEVAKEKNGNSTAYYTKAQELAPKLRAVLHPKK